MRVGGAQTMLIDILNEQCKSNAVHLVIVNKDYDNVLLSEIDSKVVVHKINRPVGSKNIYWILKLNFLLYRLLPDIIHLHNSSIIKLLFFQQSPTLLTVHATGLESKYYSLFDRLVAISDSVKDDIYTKSGFQSVVITNGIVVNKIKCGAKYNSTKFKILQVSRLEEIKGQDILIEAISLLKKKNYSVCVDFIGEGSFESRLKQLVVNLHLEDEVNFIGLKTRQYIYENLCQYDLFVQPSRFEGFGLTIAEALAAEIPVLVSNIAGPLEVIGNGDYGSSFECGNPSDCANKIEEFITMKKHFNYSHNRKYVETCYDIKITTDKYFKLYLELLNGHDRK